MTRQHASSSLVKLVAVVAGLMTVVVAGRPAEAKLVAAYLQGHGGMSSPQAESATGATSASLEPGVGIQAGARLLVFEAYGDRTSFGAGSSVTRGIFGLRGALELASVRLVLRGGGGLLAERGGALTGNLDGAPSRDGVAARAGVALEKQLATMVYGGLAVDGEVFSLAPTTMATQVVGRTSGSDIFASLHLKFEIGL